MGVFYGYKRYWFGILCKNCDHHAFLLLTRGDQAIEAQIKRLKGFKKPEKEVLSEMSLVQYRIFPKEIYEHQIHANIMISDSSGVELSRMGDSKESARKWILNDLKSLDEESPELTKIIEKI